MPNIGPQGYLAFEALVLREYSKTFPSNAEVADRLKLATENMRATPEQFAAMIL